MNINIKNRISVTVLYCMFIVYLILFFSKACEYDVCVFCIRLEKCDLHNSFVLEKNVKLFSLKGLCPSIERLNEF